MVNMQTSMGDVGSFTVTPQRVREIAHSGLVTSGPGLAENKQYMVTEGELDVIIDMLRYAVDHGQMFDFGYWPNDMIMECSKRAGALYNKDALGHPFRTPYVFIHSWDDPELPKPQNERETCTYLVNPLGEGIGGDFEAMILESLKVKGVNCFGVGDRLLLNGEESKKDGGYICNVIPFAFRFKGMWNEDFMTAARNRAGSGIEQAAVGNVIDPIMTALLLLNTQGVEQTVITTSDKLNKARVKSGKPSIPPYRRVDSTNYVTAIMQRKTRSPGGGGTHASPVMHIRRGHWRHYKSGERSFIRDSLINASQDARTAFARTHYSLKK